MTTSDSVFGDDEPVEETEFGPADAPPGVPAGSASPSGESDFGNGGETTGSAADDDQL